MAFHLGLFQADVTPPIGHPLCGGWIEPVRGVDDPLLAKGYVLLGQGKPIVLCVLDWVGLRNDAHLEFRQALADATHTTIEQVSVHAVHPHDAPFADVEAEKILQRAKGPTSLDLKFFAQAKEKVAKAAQECLKKTKRFTHLGVGQATVKEVASSRRVVGDDGKIKFTRTSATKDPKAREAPEGNIDPVLRTLSYWDNDELVMASHYYATHPMSYYGAGMVSCDFCGLAREKMQQEMANTMQIYFTGCAGNVTAGKYNDGAKENRAILMKRMYEGMKDALKNTKKLPVKSWEWRVEALKLKPRTEASFSAVESQKAVDDEKAAKSKRGNAAYQLAWLKRIERPIDVGCLVFDNGVYVLHLPGEAFIEYQLAAQKMRPKDHVFVASYGDDGCGYIPLERSFLEGGYEPTVALAHPSSEHQLMKTMAKLLQVKLPE